MTRRRHEYEHRRPIGTALDGVTMLRRDRVVNAHTVVCPDCRADLGEPCQGSDVLKGPHPVRRRMAIRLLNEAL